MRTKSLLPGAVLGVFAILVACTSGHRDKVDLATVLSQAKAEGKPVLLDFHATWCPPCRKMDEEVWPAKTVKAEVARFRFVSVDVDANPGLARRFGATSIPLICILEPDGKVRSRLLGYRPPGEVAAWLRSH